VRIELFDDFSVGTAADSAALFALQSTSFTNQRFGWTNAVASVLPQP
jgi:hypothetical protein